MSTRLPTFFISHGGGPWPWLAPMRKEFANLEASLVKMIADLPEKPKAILMISGHWETKTAKVMASAQPPMVYDYYGFPAHTYEITYPAPGAPELADRTLALLKDAGIEASLDHSQGFDHGVFAPMAIMYPNADIPLYQVSILKSYDPADHFNMGRALAPLRDEGVLIIGSGLSYHNLSLFNPAAKVPSAAFDKWLDDTLALDAAARTAGLSAWEQAPAARICHPQEDHLVPLFAALGAAETAKATRIYHDTNLRGGVTASGYRFDE